MKGEKEEGGSVGWGGLGERCGVGRVALQGEDFWGVVREVGNVIWGKFARCMSCEAPFGDSFRVISRSAALQGFSESRLMFLHGACGRVPG